MAKSSMTQRRSASGAPLGPKRKCDLCPRVGFWLLDRAICGKCHWEVNCEQKRLRTPERRQFTKCYKMRKSLERMKARVESYELRLREADAELAEMRGQRVAAE